MAHFEVLLRHLPGETGKPQNNSVTEGDGQARICIRDVQNSKGVRCSFDRNTKSKTSTERTENRKKKLYNERQKAARKKLTRHPALAESDPSKHFLHDVRQKQIFI